MASHSSAALARLLPLLLLACSAPSSPAPDAGSDLGALDSSGDGHPADAPGAGGDADLAPVDRGEVTDRAGPPPGDAVPPADGPGPPKDSLAANRDRLLATLGPPCAMWGALDASQRAVFLTLTHRLYLSRTPDGRSALSHLERVYLVLGGGPSGTSCGGSENNRLFLGMDAYLWERMIESLASTQVITDGGGSYWIPTSDPAGPHDPFDASIETDIGLRCTLIFEDSDSRPPTAQAHFFREGSAVPIERGSRISLPADPYMFEIDLDFDCIHQSNPTCNDFEMRYRTHYGDFECDWVPSACTPIGSGCYRGVMM